jgi:hypothetical protein
VLELAFVVPSRQNLFWAEIVEAIRDEARQLGYPTSLAVDGFPRPRRGLVYVLAPPHEYFALAPEAAPDDDVLRRTVMLCGEQPGTSHFVENAELAARGGAVFDLNRAAVRDFGRRGIKAEHFQLGATSTWLHHRPGGDRDIDVLYTGANTFRRQRFLAALGPSLWRRRSRIVITDNTTANWTPSPRFVAGDDKWDLLGRSKLLVNIHQSDLPYFEWQRVVGAILNGAVVVTEHSTDFEPLVPGVHFLAGSADRLRFLVDALLDDDERREQMQRDAFDFVLSRLPLRAAVRRLVAAADRVDAAALPRPEIVLPAPPPISDPPVRRFAPAPVTRDPDVSLLRQAVKELKLDLMDLRREMARSEAASAGPEARLRVVATPSYASARPEVSVLVSLYNYGHHIARALGTAASSTGRAIEIVVVDDGSTDGSWAEASAWMEARAWMPMILVGHPQNRGLPHARNAALSLARAPYSLILDADNELYPICISRLADALDADPGADFSYGILECFNHEGAHHLGSALPWEPERFRESNYIDAMAMIKTAALRRLGGYTTDRRLYGWEDYDLWCRIAEAGGRGTFVPEIVARYRTTLHSMLSLTNLSHTIAYAVLAERCPRLMAGITPPA